MTTDDVAAVDRFARLVADRTWSLGEGLHVLLPSGLVLMVDGPDDAPGWWIAPRGSAVDPRRTLVLGPGSRSEGRMRP